MQAIISRIFFCFPLFFIVVDTFSQDSSVYKWEYKSKKIADGKYELIFSTTGGPGWQLYAPDQVMGDIKTVELSFADSSITADANFVDTGITKTLPSPVDNAPVKTYEGKTEWRIPITINGNVPAKLQGKLSYFYGN